MPSMTRSMRRRPKKAEAQKRSTEKKTRQDKTNQSSKPKDKDQQQFKKTIQEIKSNLIQFNKMKNVKPVRTKADYKAALARIDELIALNPKKGTAAYDELDIIGTLVSAYEDIHYPIEAPDPVEAVKYMMEEEGLKPKDLVVYFGSKGNVSEFLNHKRGLSVRVIKALHDEFKLPYEVLLA